MKIYGVLGLAIILFLELNFFVFRIEVFEKIYFPFMWLGYILFVDALAYRIRKKSWINNNFSALIAMFILSFPFWKVFEFVNFRLGNWKYSGTEYFGAYAPLFEFVSFSTVIPAFFVTLSLFSVDFEKSKPKRELSGNSFFGFVGLGFVLFVLMMIFPKYLYVFAWLFLFFIIDAINYLNRQPSVLYAISAKQKVVGYIVASILLMGFFWEFWNYWASVKWVYIVPFLGFWKVFEMPLLGYFGYIPFGFSIYSFYFFVRHLFRKEAI